MREPVRYGQQGETGLCYMRISAISPRNGLTGKQAVDAIVLATTELAKATALALVHGEDRGARRYYETGAAVCFSGGEPYVLVLPDLPGIRRAVMTAELRTGRGSMLGPDTTRRARWWDLVLECGHQEEREALYRPAGDPQRGDDPWRRKRTGGDVLPAPRRVICSECRAAALREEAPA